MGNRREFQFETKVALYSIMQDEHGDLLISLISGHDAGVRLVVVPESPNSFRVGVRSQ